MLFRSVASEYFRVLSAGGVAAPFVESNNKSVYAQYTLRVDNRDVFQQRLSAAGVPTVVHYPIPLNRQPAVADASQSLPVGDSVAEQVVSLPMHPYLSKSQQTFIVEQIVSCAP